MKRLFALLIVFSLLLSVFTACTDMMLPVETGDAETSDVVTDPMVTDPSESTAPAETDSMETEPLETESVETETTHTHAWGNWSTVQEATCTEKGVSERACACGETETQDIEATGHTEAIDVAVAPTCTETGLTEGKHCSVCNVILVAQQTVEALGHTPGAEATCTTNHTCTVCGTELAAATGHSFGEWHETKAPTESAQGEKRHDCSNCDEYEIAPISPLSHSHDRWDTITLDAVSPTCTTTGLTEGKKCSGCSEVLVDQEVISATGHIFGEWHETKAPTESVQGEKRRDCANCDKYETTPIAALSHSHDRWDTITLGAVAPTCTTTGLTEGSKCSGCGEVLIAQKVISATGHNYDSIVIAPTCTQQGYTIHTCHCGNSYADTYVNASGHLMGEWHETLAPACTVAGSEKRECISCGLAENRTLAATGHNYGDWYVTKEPTESSPGVQRHDCANCNEYEISSIPVLSHNHNNWETIVIPAIAPTCTTTGLTAGTRCSGCGVVLIMPEIVAAMGHRYNTVVTAPSCTARGYTTHTCPCGDSYVDSFVAALGHDYKITVTLPNCTEQGFTMHTCYCGNAYVDTYVNAKGHTMGNWMTTKAPTCTSSGGEERHCTDCDHVERREIAARGHDLGYWYEVVPPTCQEPGREMRCCGNCDFYETREVAATGHVEIVEAAIPPTCCYEGRTEYTWCVVCGETLTESEVLPKTAHTAIVEEAIHPTCQYEGWTEYTWCVMCGERITEPEMIPKTEHIEIIEDAVPPTCDFEGWTEYTWCVMCGEILTEPEMIPAIGHHYESHIIAPTCTTMGYTTYACYCGDSYDDTYVEATGHALSTWTVIKAPTCTTTGTEQRECSNCNYSETRNVIATGHVLREGFDCTHGDICTICSEEFAPTNHIFTNDVCSVCGKPAAYTDEQGVSYQINPDGTAHVVSFVDGATDIIIPEEIIGCMVTNIKDQAFYKKKITSVVIPGTVETIGIRAFSECRSLKKVILNEGLKIIKTNAFWRCHLEWVVIPESVDVIESSAFYNYKWSNWSDYTGKIYCKVASRPEGWVRDFVKGEDYICEDRKTCFWDFDEFVEQDEIIYAISWDRLEAEIVRALVKKNSLILPNTVEGCTVIGIAPYAFCLDSYSYSVNSIALPQYVRYINQGAFASIDANGVELLFPETLEYIDYAAFAGFGNSYNNKVEFLSASLNIESCAFRGSTLSELNLPLNAIGKIEREAFAYCDGLMFTNIPYQMVVEDNAFLGCSSIKLCCLADRRPADWGDEWEDGIPIEWSSYVDSQGVVYKFNENIQYEGQPTMTVIDYWNNNEYTTVMIPSEILGRVVWMIGEEAFWDTKLNKVYIPKTVQVIAERAFDSTLYSKHYEYGSRFSSGDFGVLLDRWIYTQQNHAITIIANIPQSDYTVLIDYWDDETQSYYDFYIAPNNVEKQDVVVPETIDGMPVIGIDSGAFSGCSNLTAIVIPNTVTIIGHEAFYGCTGLTSIAIPNSVTSIGSSAFRGCSGLTSIVIPDNVTNIGSYAFAYCSSLTSIVIPDSVTSIGMDAFFDCTSLLEIENGVYYVDKWVVDCDTDITSVVLRDDTVGIGNSAFSGCKGLTSIVIPDSVTSIGESAFYNCAGLSSIIIPDSVTSIGSSAFRGCSVLTSIVIPDSVTSIGMDAFSDCTRLLEIENGVYYVDKWVVDCDTDITSVVLRDNTVGIGNNAFYGCKGLTSIVIPDSVTSIGRNAFAYCSSLTSVVIPDGVTSIEDWTFESCRSLTSIVIPDSVTSIGKNAFRYCESLTSVVIPDSVTSIGDYAFYYCKSLTSVVIPDGVSSIGDYAFQWCSGIKSLTFGNSLIKIGNETFYGCKGLTNIILPGSVTSIGDEAFRRCSNLNKVSFEGTMEQWKSIALGYSVTLQSPATKVICFDGTVPLN